MKSLAKNGMFNVIYSVANMIFPLITSIFISRILLVEGIGKVSYAQNIVSYFVAFAALGQPVYGTREIAKVRFRQEEKDKVFSELFILNSISTTFFSIVYVVLVFSVSRLNSQLPLMLASGLLIFFNYINVDWFYQGEEEYEYIAVRSIVIKTISIAAILIFVRSKEDYILYALISSLAMGGNYIFNIFNLNKKVSFTFKGLDIKRHIMPLLILMTTIFLGSVYSKIDITMLGIFKSDYDVGIYSYAFKIINMIITACIAISTVFLPRLSFYYINDKINFNKLVQFGIRLITFISVPAAVGTFLLSEKIVVLLFGTAFKPASVTIQIFAILIIVKAFGDLLCYQLMICTGNEKKRLPAYFLAAVSNILLNLMLIPSLSYNGAVIASVITEFIVNGVQFVYIKKLVKLSMDWKSVRQAIFSTIFMAVIVIIIINITENLSLIFQVILSIVLGGGTYMFINIVTKNEILYSVVAKMKNITK